MFDKRRITFIVLTLLLFAAMYLLVGCTGNPKPQPPQPPTPTPVPQPTPDPDALPAKGTPVRLDLLLRPAPGARLATRDGKPVQWFQAIQCCGGADGTVLPAGTNSRWPLASESWMDAANKYGANAVHFRVGPFFAGDDFEVEWNDIGGPYRGDASAQVPAPLPWNDAYWQKVRELTWYAARKNMWAEVVVVETWGVKHAQWGDWKLPWPQEDINAGGRRPSPEQERWIRKVVEELGCFGNVIWATDNEGDQIQGNKPEYFEWVASVIRDEEKKSGCNVVHMIGTNSGYGDGPYDFVITHARQPLTEPKFGKWTLNNERNPTLGPENEAANFAQAREKGLGWALWLANAKGDQVPRMFELFRDVAQGGAAVGCFPAPEDDPRWVGGPVKGCPDDVLRALAQAKAELGDPRPAWQACQRNMDLQPEDRTPIACMFPTLEALSESMRRQGFCAGRTRDAITAKADDASTLWYEIHATGATDGGYAGTPCKGSTWRLQ